ncbi:MAG: chorismate synthase [bacterium P3]|nr:MAG: chorismate synthase [bacterium P3]KWW42756.1 MAG: chorismate synthase [bacterium F083]
MNCLGRYLRLTTFGESHGTAVGGVMDGCPAGLRIDTGQVAAALKRRRSGDVKQESVTKRQEPDEVEWLSGLMEGVTTGQPIGFVLRNRDVRSEDYEALRDVCRPGHADFTYLHRYGMRDWRGGGRASGRETAARVVAGAVARQLCEKMWQGFKVSTCADEEHCVVCTVEGVPAGVGSPLFDKVNARLAHAMMSIPSAIGFEMGAGFAGATWDAATWRDEWNEDGTTRSNHCGGVQGGISNGMPIVFRTAFHAPVTTLEHMVCLNTREGRLQPVCTGGRHDSDHIGRLPSVVEAMACWTLADLGMEKFNGGGMGPMGRMGPMGPISPI